MGSSSSDRLRVVGLGGLFVLALVVGLELVRPFAAGPVGFDTSASVIHFQRIAAGRHLEAFVTATPKPLLTVLDGVLFTLTSDWRAVSFAAIAGFAIAVALGGWLAWRWAGPIAGAALAVGLLGSRSLLSDVTIAYAVPIALPLWIGAGLAITAAPRRPALAGILLGLATLARLETIAVLGVAALVLVIRTVVRRRQGLATERSDWLVLVGFFALPVMLLHDWLLTGDPFFWLSVSARFSAEAPDAVLSPFALIRLIATRYASMPILSVLAITGLIALARRRRWLAAGSIVALGGGIVGLLLALAIRHTYVSARYLTGIDLALLGAAAVGAAWVAVSAVELVRRRRPLWRAASWVPTAAAAAVATALMVVAIWPVASLSRAFRTAAQTQRLLAVHADRAIPVVDCLLATLPGSRDVAPTGATGSPILLVPTLERPRFVVDTGIPRDKVARTPPSWLTPGSGFLPAGRVIVHDRLGNRPPAAFAILEVATPTTIGSTTLVPILADPAAGLWIVWVMRAGETAAPSCSPPRA